MNNRIITPGFEYDPAGNQIRAVIAASGTQQQYRYDCVGRLAQVLDASGNVLATYTYGAGNQRLMSVEGGVTKYYAWDGGQIIAEYEAWGTNGLIWKTSYVYLGGRLLATTSGADGSETRYHHPDRLGTRLVTNASDGAAVSEQWTLPFGNMQPFVSAPGGESPYQNPTLSNPSKKRFTTYDRSDATGLDYAVNRFYSPQQGRFTQVDPIGMGAASLGNPQTLNMYAYCGNDPINHVDPEGLLFGWLKKLFRVILKIAAVIVTVAAVLATVWNGNPFITIAAWKLWLGAGALWAAAYGAGKLSRVLGGVAGFGTGGGVGSILTPKTFPDQSRVGPVNGFLQAAQSGKKQKEDKKDPCDISDIVVPAGVSVDQNIGIAQEKFRKIQIWMGMAGDQGGTAGLAASLLWFREQVRNAKGRVNDVRSGRSWDYKQLGAQYENFGNFNYGATGAAIGIPDDILFEQAGKAQIAAKSSQPQWKGPPYFGDDPRDHDMIQRGIDYYKAGCYKRNK